MLLVSISLFEMHDTAKSRVFTGEVKVSILCLRCREQMINVHALAELTFQFSV